MPPARASRGWLDHRSNVLSKSALGHVDVETAARLLCVSEATVRNLVRDGVLVTVADGMRVRITLASVDAELARRYPGLVRKTEG